MNWNGLIDFSTKQSPNKLIKSSVKTNRIAQCPKLYGTVELEIEVTELLENISTALCCLQKLDLLATTKFELRIFQKDVVTLIDAVTNLKCKIQKTFKNITFEEDICLTPSKEIPVLRNSSEVADKIQRNIQESKEDDEMHSESAIFQHRLAAGASIIAQKKARFKKKNQKHIRMNSDAVKQIIGNSVYNNSESKQFVNFSSYDISNNSETSIPSALWKRKHLEKANKLEEIQKSENVEKLSGIIAAEKKEIESEQVLIKQNLSEIERVVEDLYKNRCFVSRSAAPSYLSAQLYGSPKMEKRKYPRLRDKL